MFAHVSFNGWVPFGIYHLLRLLDKGKYEGKGKSTESGKFSKGWDSL